MFYDEDWYRAVGDKSRMPDVNLRYCLAVTMLDGRLRFDASHDPVRMDDPAVIAMGRHIAMLGSTPRLDRFAAVVEVDPGGRTFRWEQGRNVLGRYENPMSRQQVEDEALELMRTALPKQRARKAIAIIARIEDVPMPARLSPC